MPFSWLQIETDCSLALLTGCQTRWGSQIAAIIRVAAGQVSNAHLAFSEGSSTSWTPDSQRLSQIHVEWPKAPGAESAAFQSEPQGAGVRFSKVDQVLWQFGKLVALYKGIGHMVVSLERWWAKMEQKLFLVAYALVANAAWSMHTASTLPATLQTCMSLFEAVQKTETSSLKSWQTTSPAVAASA